MRTSQVLSMVAIATATTMGFQALASEPVTVEQRLRNTEVTRILEFGVRADAERGLPADPANAQTIGAALGALAGVNVVVSPSLQDWRGYLTLVPGRHGLRTVMDAMNLFRQMLNSEGYDVGTGSLGGIYFLGDNGEVHTYAEEYATFVETAENPTAEDQRVLDSLERELPMILLRNESARMVLDYLKVLSRVDVKCARGLPHRRYYTTNLRNVSLKNALFYLFVTDGVKVHVENGTATLVEIR